MQDPVDDTVHRGVLEGTSRVLRALLQTPQFKESLRVLLREFDPQNAGRIVRVIREEDPELFLGILAAKPRVLNAAFEGIRELLVQLHGFPPGLTREFAGGLAGDVDAERAGEVLGLLFALYLRLPEERNAEEAAEFEPNNAFAAGLSKGIAASGADAPDAWNALADRAIDGLDRWMTKVGERASDRESPTAKTVDRLAAGIAEVVKKNPGFVEHVVSPLIAAAKGEKADD